MPELIDGRLIEREKGQRLDAIACRAAFLIGNHAARTQAGLVNGSRCGFRIFRDVPDKVRVVDASFTRSGRLPDGPAQDHATVVPDLVVEVVSAELKAGFLQAKIIDFLKAGVSLFWVIDPWTKIVEVNRQDGSARRLQVGDVLDGEDVLPGFHCEVAALFA